MDTDASAAEAASAAAVEAATAVARREERQRQEEKEQRLRVTEMLYELKQDAEAQGDELRRHMSHAQGRPSQGVTFVGAKMRWVDRNYQSSLPFS